MLDRIRLLILLAVCLCFSSNAAAQILPDQSWVLERFEYRIDRPVFLTVSGERLEQVTVAAFAAGTRLQEKHNDLSFRPYYDAEGLREMAATLRVFEGKYEARDDKEVRRQADLRISAFSKEGQGRTPIRQVGSTTDDKLALFKALASGAAGRDALTVTPGRLKKSRTNRALFTVFTETTSCCQIRVQKRGKPASILPWHKIRPGEAKGMAWNKSAFSNLKSGKYDVLARLLFAELDDCSDLSKDNPSSYVLYSFVEIED